MWCGPADASKILCASLVERLPWWVSPSSSVKCYCCGAHSASSKDCHRYKYDREILIRIQVKVSFLSAKKKVLTRVLGPGVTMHQSWAHIPVAFLQQVRLSLLHLWLVPFRNGGQRDCCCMAEWDSSSQSQAFLSFHWCREGSRGSLPKKPRPSNGRVPQGPGVAAYRQSRLPLRIAMPGWARL